MKTRNAGLRLVVKGGPAHANVICDGAPQKIIFFSNNQVIEFIFKKALFYSMDKSMIIDQPILLQSSL